MEDAPPSSLGEPALVLNRSWVPIATTSVRRAWSLVYREAARVIDPDTYALHDWSSWVSIGLGEDSGTLTTRGILRNPEVILLRRHDRAPRRSVPFSRRTLYRRDGSRCQYCGRAVSATHASIDHVVPRAVGGRTSFENCVLACVPCNVRKGSRTPSQAGMSLIAVPKAPRWSPWHAVAAKRQRESWRLFLPPAELMVEEAQSSPTERMPASSRDRRGGARRISLTRQSGP